MSPKGSSCECPVPSQRCYLYRGGRTLRWHVLASRSRSLSRDRYWRLQLLCLQSGAGSLISKVGGASAAHPSLSGLQYHHALTSETVSPKTSLTQTCFHWVLWHGRLCFFMAFFTTRIIDCTLKSITELDTPSVTEYCIRAGLSARPQWALAYSTVCWASLDQPAGADY